MSDKTPIDDDDDGFERERTAARLNGPEAIPLFSGFMMAAMASGRTPKAAANEADLAMTELRKRFT